jgi:hypothetical protein
LPYVASSIKLGKIPDSAARLATRSTHVSAGNDDFEELSRASQVSMVAA